MLPPTGDSGFESLHEVGEQAPLLKDNFVESISDQRIGASESENASGSELSGTSGSENLWALGRVVGEPVSSTFSAGASSLGKPKSQGRKSDAVGTFARNPASAHFQAATGGGRQSMAALRARLLRCSVALVLLYKPFMRKTNQRKRQWKLPVELVGQRLNHSSSLSLLWGRHFRLSALGLALSHPPE